MSHRLGALPQATEEARDVEVGIGKLRIQGQGLLVVRDGFGEALLIFQGDGQIVVAHRIVGCGAQRVVVEARGLRSVAGLVGEAAEVDVGIGQLRVELEGGAIGLASAIEIVLAFEAQGALEPGEWALRDAPRRPSWAARPVDWNDDAGGASQIVDCEAEDDLAAVGSPRRTAVMHNDLAPVGVDVNAGERASGWQLCAQLGKRMAHTARGNLGGQQPLGGAQADKILKPELPDARAAGGTTESRAHHGPHARWGNTENACHIAGTKGLQWRPSWPRLGGRSSYFSHAQPPTANSPPLPYDPHVVWDSSGKHGCASRTRGRTEKKSLSSFDIA